MLSGSVAACMFVVQMLVYVPSVITEYRASVEERFDIERDLLLSTFRSSDRDALEIPDTLLSDTLVGLVLSIDGDRLLLNKGNTLDVSLIHI